jgi:hypothetical protein
MESNEVLETGNNRVADHWRVVVPCLKSTA